MIEYHITCVGSIGNIKAHGIYNDYLSSNKKYTFHPYDTKNIKNLIETNLKNSHYFLIFYGFQKWCYQKDLIEIIDFIDNCAEIKMKIVFFPCDFWRNGNKITSSFFKKLFCAKNHYVITYADDVETLSTIWNVDFTKYYDKILRYSFWCVYKLSIIDFNESPENKIILSGAYNGKSYPDRSFASKFNKYITILKYNDEEVRGNQNIIDNNNYSKELNKYLCNFTSNVYAFTDDKKFIPIHFLVTKVYEILASGSLLLYPKKEEKYLEEVGLYDNIHCKLIDCENEHEFRETCKYILDKNNRDEIDKIRRNGQKYAIENLSSEKKYNELVNIFNKL